MEGTSDDADMFRAICESSPHAVLAADPAGLIVWVNQAAERVFGWSRAELVGRPLTSVTTDAHHGAAHAARRRLLAGGSSEQLLAEGLRRDGTTFEMSVATSARRGGDGGLRGIGVIAVDVSPSVRVQRELAEALALSRARFDQVDNPQALLDLDARVIAVNDAACTLLSRAREDLVAASACELFVPTEREAATAHYHRLRDGETSSVSGEAVALRGDGTQVPVLLDLSVVRDDSGPREYALFVRDLSDVRDAQRRLEAQAGFVRALQRRASDIVVVSGGDATIRYVSPSVTTALGFSVDEVVGRATTDFLEPGDRSAARERRERLRSEGSGATTRQMLRVRDAAGRLHWLDGAITNCLDDPDIGGMVTNLRDVTAEIEAEEALRASEARFRAIAQTAQEGILAMAPDGTVIFANDKLAEIAGVDIESLYAHGIRPLLDPVEVERMEERLARRGEIGPERYEVAYHHPDGTDRTWFVAASPLTYDDGTPIGSLGMISDVTAAKESEAELKHRALHDSLTGLPNRVLLVDRLTVAAARSEREGGRGLAVLFLDLDHFKAVNDERGHEAGDVLLTQVAGRLLSAVRDVDTVARLGGDEFAVICEDTGAEGAELVAARIQRDLAAPFDLADGTPGQPVRVSASIGVALSPPHGVTDLLRFADAAMYDAKAAGRDRWALFSGPVSA